jgi:cell wall-associated NlpC family hydrolase
VRGKALWMSMMLLGLSAAAAAPAAAQSPAPAPAPVPAPAPAAVPAPAPAPSTGGAAYGVVFQPMVPGFVAQIVNGVAYAPDQAPDQVKQAIWAANQIVGMPYRLGGGHRLGFADKAYDCSGTVSFAMHGAGLLATPRDSSSFMRYGAAGKGQWITIYTNRGHAFAVIAGLRLDTSAAGDPAGGSGPRWRPNLRSTRGYRARHPIGL